MDGSGTQPANSRPRGMRAFDLPGPRLLPAAILPLMRTIALPVLVLAVALDILLFAASKAFSWPCWSSFCLFVG